MKVATGGPANGNSVLECCCEQHVHVHLVQVLC
jgi:hypothetical protein